MGQDVLNASLLRGTSRLRLRALRLPGDVVMVTLLERVTVTAVTVGDAAWDQLVLTDESFEALGPGILDAVIHADFRNTTGVFGARVVLQRKFGDSDWIPSPGGIVPGDLLLPETTADGYAPLVVFNDRSRLNAAKIRLVLQYHAKATGGGVVGAKSEITMAVALRPFGS